jgi:2-polyprenyl-3-methyl-5-hydroxy-6-metoxy-1,4-benzoquinol methylase
MMGDLNQLDFIKKNIKKFQAPYLEIGSRYGLTWEMRKLFSDSEYIGIDMEDGPGVDVVLDLAKDFTSVDRILKRKRFNTVFCLSVLEHCSNPFIMAENITNLLNKNGVLYVSVPFSWAFHAFPSDYWRFTPEGVRILFPKMVFNIENSNMSTSDIGDIRKIDNDLCRIRFSASKFLRQKKYGMAATAAIIKMTRKLGIASWIFKYRYLFPPVLINMIGVKKEDA